MKTTKILKYISLLVAILAASMALFVFAGCNGSGEKEKHSIVVAGSTSVQPYAELLAEEFERITPGVKVDVTGGGSAAGASSAHSGVADIGMLSRDLKTSGNESELTPILIAEDGLAVIVHPDNPVADLTLEHIRKIYTAEFKNWSDVGGLNDAKGKPVKINAITREDGSGMRTAFEELVMLDELTKEKHRINPRAVVSPSNGAIRYLVSDDKNAIGFISLGLVKSEGDEKDVKAISLDGTPATVGNVKDGSYKLSRPFLFVTMGEPTGLVKEFIDFVLGEGKKILDAEGLIT